MSSQTDFYDHLKVYYIYGNVAAERSSSVLRYDLMNNHISILKPTRISVLASLRQQLFQVLLSPMGKIFLLICSLNVFMDISQTG